MRTEPINWNEAFSLCAMENCPFGVDTETFADHEEKILAAARAYGFSRVAWIDTSADVFFHQVH